MCIREWLCGALGCCEPESDITPPNYSEEIGYDEVYSILNAEFPECSLLLSDNDYKTTTKQEMMRFLKEDNTDKYQVVLQGDYKQHYKDSDDDKLSHKSPDIPERELFILINQSQDRWYKKS